MQIDPDESRGQAVPPPADAMQLRDVLALLDESGAGLPGGAEWLLDRLDPRAEDRP